MPQLIGSGAGFFTLADDNGVENDYQRGSVRPRVLGDNVGLNEVGNDDFLTIVNPTRFDDWLDPTSTPYPDVATLLVDLQDNIFLDLSNAGDVPEAPVDGVRYGRQDAGWLADPIQDDAPADGNTYGRNNNAWALVPVDTFVRTWQFNAVIDQNNVNNTRDFDRDQGMATNLTPFIVPEDSEIYFLVANAENANTFNVQVLVNDVVQATVNVVAATQAILDLTATPIAVSQGDRIRLRHVFLGSNSRNPASQVYIRTQ